MIADVHEPGRVLEALRARGCAVEARPLQPGDYLVGPVGIERKTLSDFFSSIVRRRLFDRVGRLRETYPLCLLLVEGDLGEVATQRNPAAFWGAFAAVTLGERVPILFTRDVTETALVLDILEKRYARGASDYGVGHTANAARRAARRGGCSPPRRRSPCAAPRSVRSGRGKSPPFSTCGPAPTALRESLPRANRAADERGGQGGSPREGLQVHREGPGLQQGDPHE